MRHRFREAADAATEIVPAYDDPRDYRRRRLEPQVDSQAIERAAGQAVMAALAEQGDGARIVVVNVNIQIAHGGGATNQFSTAPNTQQVGR
jgi:sulfur carrier protein ThiS